MNLNTVAFSPAESRIYMGSPSILRLPSGSILISHDHFGPAAPRNEHGMPDRTFVYRSGDDGATWHRVAGMTGQWWSGLFLHQGAVWILGVSAEYGHIVIRRSTDDGATWTQPADSSSGLLFAGGPGGESPNYHCAPVPVLFHSGRIWRAFEDNTPRHWPQGFQACVISAGEDSDLLRADSWIMTNKLPYVPDADPPELKDPKQGEGWLEGNVVCAPCGELWNVLRVNSGIGDWGAILRISEDGRHLSLHPDHPFIPFPGGHTKFTIRRDPESNRYWTLANGTVDPLRKVRRQLLSLFSSTDLLSWDFQRRVVGDESLDPQSNGFQYVDWQFDGEDIIVACRTAWNGAHNFHDANHLTFHVIRRFRDIPPQALPLYRFKV